MYLQGIEPRLLGRSAQLRYLGSHSTHAKQNTEHHLGMEPVKGEVRILRYMHASPPVTVISHDSFNFLTDEEVRQFTACVYQIQVMAPILTQQNELWCVRSRYEAVPKGPAFARSATVNLNGHRWCAAGCRYIKGGQLGRKGRGF